MISAGEFVQASGSWTNDRTHGVQFRASFLKATAPTFHNPENGFCVLRVKARGQRDLITVM
jgi:hypothetical protein